MSRHMDVRMGLDSPEVRAYGQQVMRWNTQINLISRRDPQGRLDSLLFQSAAGITSVWNHLLDSRLGETTPTGENRLWYFDLGSGGGLPGFIWHVMLSRFVPHLTTCLVEPRDKRAWFLARLDQACGAKPLQVWRGRWAEAPSGAPEEPGFLAPSTSPDTVLISLKALHLTDGEVLTGLSPLLGGRQDEEPAPVRAPNVLITRYYPPEQRLDEDLVSNLGIVASGATLEAGGLAYLARDRGVLGAGEPDPRGAGIVFSAYILV